MTIVSTELRQVFRAYTKQLRGQYANASPNQKAKETVAKGFERVDISDEARALAMAGQPVRNEKEVVQSKNQKTNNSDSKEEDKEESKKEEKESTSPKGEPSNSRIN